MSLVGPRPIVEEEVPLYGSNIDRYFSCRPGITGLWQVSGRTNTTYEQRVRLDTIYADSHSLLLDIRILLQTVRVVLMGTGAF
jgi:lipopolysaccharide/colanic/teichoic acid biosynthesis glycosyltransferase